MEAKPVEPVGFGVEVGAKKSYLNTIKRLLPIGIPFAAGGLDTGFLCVVFASYG